MMIVYYGVTVRKTDIHKAETAQHSCNIYNSQHNIDRTSLMSKTLLVSCSTLFEDIRLLS